MQNNTSSQQQQSKVYLPSEEMIYIHRHFKDDSFLKMFVENFKPSEAFSFDVATYLKNKLKEEEDDQSTNLKSTSLESEILKLSEGVSAIDSQIFKIFEKQSSQLEEEESEFKSFLFKSLGDELTQHEELADVSLVNQYQKVMSGKGFYKSIFEIQNLDEDLNSIKKSVDLLQTSVNRLQSSLGASATNLTSRHKQLENMFATLELMKKVYSFLSMISKLKKGYNGYNSDQTNLFATSQYIFELEQVVKSRELENITIVDKEIPYIQNISNEVKNEATKAMKEGMKNKQQSTVATALQVFFNFNILSEMINETVTHQINSVSIAVNSVFSQKPTKSTESTFKTQFLVSLKSLFSDMETLYQQVYHLDLVVKKKRDTLSQRDFSAILIEKGNENFLELFWNSVQKSISLSMKKVMDNQVLKEIFVNEYPQIKSMVKEFFNALVHQLPTQELRNQSWIITMLDPFEVQYLYSSLNRLVEKTKLVFGKVSPPKPKETTFKGLTTTDIRQITSLMLQELNNVKSDEKLFFEIGKNIAKTIQLFCNSIEEFIITDASSRDVDLLSVLEGSIGKSTTPAQLFNANLFNSTYFMLASTTKSIKTMSGLPAFATLEKMLEISLKKLDEIGKQITGPIFDTISRQLLTILLNMHLSEEEMRIKQQQLEMSRMNEIGVEYNTNTLFVCQFFYCLKHAKRVYFQMFDQQTASVSGNMFIPLIEKLYIYITIEITLKTITLSRTFPLEEREIHFLTLLNDAKQLQAMIADFLSDDSNHQTKGHLLFKTFLKIIFVNDFSIIDKQLAINDASHAILVSHLLMTKIENVDWIIPPHEYTKTSLREYSKWWIENMQNSKETIILENLGKCITEMKKKDTESASKAIPIIENVVGKNYSNSESNLKE